VARSGNGEAGGTVLVNRAPVLTLWAAVVAHRLGHDRDTALTLGKTVAGLDAQTKARRLGIVRPAEKAAAKAPHARKPAPARSAVAVPLLGREVPVIETPDGLRAVPDGKPVTPESVTRYLEGKFGERLAATRAAMEALAQAWPPVELEEAAFGLYERFRPQIPPGKRGWGVKGVLDLDLIRSLAATRKR
jgi:hypothetical protein